MSEVDAQISISYVVAQYPQKTLGGIGVNVFEVLDIQSVAENVFEEGFGEVYL